LQQRPGSTGQGSNHPDFRDDSAPRRTWLAAERTYLAWLRTGLAAVGVALAVGRLVPALIGGSDAVYAALGTGYGLLGVFMVVYAMLRLRRVAAALRVNGPVTLEWWAIAVVTAIGVALAVATILTVLVAA
jgi:putative membrane protein